MWRRQDVWRSFNLSRGRFPVTSGNFLYNIAPHSMQSRIGSIMGRWLIRKLLFCAALVLSGHGFAFAGEAEMLRHGIAMHGQPSLAADFDHLPYANPQAPKGGRITLALQGTFDSLNPLIVLGVAPDVVPRYVLQSLMMRSTDEPFTVYGLVARPSKCRKTGDPSLSISIRVPVSPMGTL